MTLQRLEQHVCGRTVAHACRVISTVGSLFARYRPAAHAVRRAVHQRYGRSAHFFRGVLIGLAILMAIWLVIG
jgi:hypothetical protein